MKNKIICKNCGSSDFELIINKGSHYTDLMGGAIEDIFRKMNQTENSNIGSIYGMRPAEAAKLKCKHCGWEFKPDTKDFIDAFFKQ